MMGLVQGNRVKLADLSWPVIPTKVGTHNRNKAGYDDAVRSLFSNPACMGPDFRRDDGLLGDKSQARREHRPFTRLPWGLVAIWFSATVLSATMTGLLLKWIWPHLIWFSIVTFGLGAGVAKLFLTLFRRR